MYSVFLSSYTNTRESLAELDKAVETAFLVLPNFHSRTRQSCGNTHLRLVFPQHFSFSQTSTRVCITRQKHGTCFLFLKYQAQLLIDANLNVHYLNEAICRNDSLIVVNCYKSNSLEQLILILHFAQIPTHYLGYMVVQCLACTLLCRSRDLIRKSAGGRTGEHKWNAGVFVSVQIQFVYCLAIILVNAIKRTQVLDRRKG